MEEDDGGFTVTVPHLDHDVLRSLFQKNPGVVRHSDSSRYLVRVTRLYSSPSSTCEVRVRHIDGTRLYDAVDEVMQTLERNGACYVVGSAGRSVCDPQQYPEVRDYWNALMECCHRKDSPSITAETALRLQIYMIRKEYKSPVLL